MVEKNSLIKQIIENKKLCIFLSPHYDDAVLSCGGLITYLSGKTEVVVVNVFTETGMPPYTFSAKVFLRNCGFNNAKVLFEQRKKEDTEVFNSLNVKTVNLGFTDALWRRYKHTNLISKILGKYIPEMNYVYKTGRFHILRGKVSKEDEWIINKIKQKISKFISNENLIVFSPSAIGNHVDHIIIREICRQLNSTTIFWQDYPYNLRLEKNVNLWFKDRNNVLIYNKKQKEKLKLIKGYKTQIKGLFPDGKIKLLPERYFLQKKLS